MPEQNQLRKPQLFAMPDHVNAALIVPHVLAARFLQKKLSEFSSAICPLTLSGGIESARHFPPDEMAVVVIDLSGLSRPVTEYLETFKAAIDDCSFLAMDRARTTLEVAQLLLAGFSGFIAYDDVQDLLFDALQCVIERKVWFSPEAIRLYMDWTSSRVRSRECRPGLLTVREHQILELLRLRYSNKEIGAALCISERTVKFHVSNVLGKLNLGGRRDVNKLCS
jgi:DNA-binding NarL/FixJ family response regulator